MSCSLSARRLWAVRTRWPAKMASLQVFLDVLLVVALLLGHGEQNFLHPGGVRQGSVAFCLNSAKQRSHKT
jgi:hypothetical protein